MGGRGDHRALERAMRLARPVAMAHEQALAVHPALAGALPEGGLRRGSTIGVDSTSIALALTVEATRQGSWAAAVGLPSLGLAAAGELGLVLERLMLVDAPADGALWATVVAALVDAVDVVLVAPARGRVTPTLARRVAARARERGAVLIEISQSGVFEADLRVRVAESTWYGLHDGAGHLHTREMEIEVVGRRGAARPRRLSIWLPDSRGGISPAEIVESPESVPALEPLRSVG